MAYKRLNLAERMEIFKGLYHLKMSPSKIAKKLNRSPSTITREIKKGSEEYEYNPFLSEYRHLDIRRQQCRKLRIDNKLWREIKPRLELRWSPIQISSYLADSRIGQVSAKTRLQEH